jgi:hypothetical protein
VRALAVETHENWLEGMRYLNMDHMKEHRQELPRHVRSARKATGGIVPAALAAQPKGGSEHGPAIALDIARSHGGDITLGDSRAGVTGNGAGAGVTPARSALIGREVSNKLKLSKFHESSLARSSNFFRHGCGV